MAPMKKVAIPYLLLPISVLVLLLLCETASRLMFRIHNGYWWGQSFLLIPDKDLGYRNNPYYLANFQEVEEVGRMFNGFRGPPFSIPKQPNVYRIIALGGSTTWGDGVGWNESYPYKLAELLNSNSGEATSLRYEVINAGTMGYTSKQIELFAKKYLLDLQPDLVIIDSGWNDIFSNEAPYYYIPQVTVAPDGSFAQTVKAILARSCFYRSVISLCKKIGIIQDHNPGTMFDRIAKILEYDIPRRYTRFQRNIEELISYCAQYHMPIVLTIFPISSNENSYVRTNQLQHKYVKEKAKLEQLYNVMVATIHDIAEKGKVLCVDCASPFDNIESHQRWEYFCDFCHLTAKGNDIIAGTIKSSLATHGLL